MQTAGRRNRKAMKTYIGKAAVAAVYYSFMAGARGEP